MGAARAAGITARAAAAFPLGLVVTCVAASAQESCRECGDSQLVTHNVKWCCRARWAGVRQEFRDKVWGLCQACRCGVDHTWVARDR